MPSVAELPTPDEIMAAPEWGRLDASQRTDVVDNWAMETRHAHDWQPEQLAAIDGAIDQFHSKAKEGFGEWAGRKTKEAVVSAGESMASIPGALVKVGLQEGKAGAVMLQGGGTAELERNAPDVVNAGIGAQNIIGGAKALARQNNPLSKNDEEWQGKLDALKKDVLERKLPEDPDKLFDALRKHGLGISQATAKLHGAENPTGYAPQDLLREDLEPAIRERFKATLAGKRPDDFRDQPDDTSDPTFRNQSRSLVGSPENLGLLMQFSATRNPKYFDALVQRLGRSTEQQTRDALSARVESRRGEDAVDKATRSIFGLAGKDFGEEMVGQTRGMASSPVDLATTLFSFGLGKAVVNEAKKSLLKASGKAALGLGTEFAQGAASGLGDQSVPTMEHVIEQGLMEAAAGGVIQTAGAVTQGVANQFQKPEAPSYKSGGAAPVTPLPPGIEGATDAEFNAAENGVLAQIAANAGREAVSTPAPETAPQETPQAPPISGIAPGQESILTEKAQELLATVNETGEVPSFMTPDLAFMAYENGIDVKPGMSAQEIYQALAARDGRTVAPPTSSASPAPSPTSLQPAQEAATETSPTIPQESETGQASATPTVLPEEFKGAWDHGLELVKQGVTDFAQWSIEMVKKFGEAIRDYLKDVWAAATKTSEKGAVQLGGTVEKQASNLEGPLAPGEHAPEPGDAVEQRSFGKRVAEDPRMNPKVQAQATQDYVPIENVETLAQANAIIDQIGLDAASAAVRDAGSPMPPHVRVALGMQTMLRLDQEARALRNAGDLAGAAALWDQTGQMGKVVDALGTEAGRAVQAFAMWTRLTPEGILTTFEKKVREVNKGVMPTLPKELTTKLGELRDKINALPEGSPLRADLMREMMSELALYQGIPVGSVFAALWYANMLSGLTTQGINVYGNSWGLFLRTAAAGLVNHPRDTLNMIIGMFRGLDRARTEAGAALRGKIDSRNAQDAPTVDALTKRNALEIMLDRPPSDWKSWYAWINSVGGLTKYVTRTLTAMDAVFYYTAAEGRAHLAASRAARQGAKPGTPEFVQAMAAQLGRGEGAWDAAMQEAEQQLKSVGKPVTNADKKRIAYKIMDDARSPELREEAGRFGEIVTSQQEPDGLARLLYNILLPMQKFSPFGVPVGRVFVPFARTLVNLMSNAADFTVFGIGRGLRGKHLSSPQTTFSAAESRERIAAGVLGTLVSGAVLSAALGHEDEDDETTKFMIYGMGPKTPSRRGQMPKGWRPYTIKFGNHYWSYAETPLVFALAPIGAIMDARRYDKKLSEKSQVDRFAYYTEAVLKATFAQGVTSSMADLLGVMTGDVAPAKLPSRFTGGMIPAHGFLRDVTGLFDPTKISDDTIAASILRDVPVIRHMVGHPDLDYMGDPITYEGLSRIPVMKRIVADQRSEDRDKAWVGKMGLNIPALTKTIEVGKYLTENERTAAKMSRVDADMLTPEERYAFAKRAGQLTREAVKAMRLNHEDATRTGAPTLDAEAYQKFLNAKVTAARKIAMRELMFRQ